ncbi:MAG: tripartite tricarboxylate transporter substrate binding protein, partial [Proteobacteria bacterium]|nr:tripartite tricarboxylate transporter substrate binding protein [Pseudomonadota bacterium]
MLLAASAACAVAQPALPDRPVRLIVPYATGGSTDLLARLVAPKLTERWGQQVIVDNRPGGNTIIGTQAVTRSVPDGQTALMMAIAHTIIPNLMPVPYDPVRDFTPLGTISRGELVLVVHPSVGANSLQELAALARAKPGTLNYASASTGGPLHLAGELFNMLAGVKTTHIPYKGGGPAMTDLLGGQVQALLISVTLSAPHIRSGKLRALGVAAEKRSSLLPQVPTFGEGGFPSMRAETWNGLFVPTGTSQAIVQRLHTEFGRAIRAPEVEARFRELGA